MLPSCLCERPLSPPLTHYLMLCNVPQVEVIVAPPLLHLAAVKTSLNPKIKVAAQVWTTGVKHWFGELMWSSGTGALCRA
eukprot:364753-Chlamydomonas_euryale.AAC.1